MVVQGHVAQQGVLQVERAVEAMGVEHITDATIETLDHAIGFGRLGFGQAMLDAKRLAQLVELVIARVKRGQ